MTTRSVAETIREDLPSLSLDAETRSFVERWLATDGEFNVWFLVTTKRALADDELLALLDGYRDAQETAEDAWRSFVGQKGDTAALRTGLAASLATMTALMKK